MIGSRRWAWLAQIFWAGLIILLIGACTRKSEDHPPSNREDTPAAEDRSDRRDDRSDSQFPPSGAPRAPQAEVQRNEYTVQVGIFNRSGAADTLASRLRAERVNNFVQRVGNQWRVCVGRYYSEKPAGRTASQLRQMGFTEAKVIAPTN